MRKGSRAIDISGRDERLYSVTTPLMLGVILVGIPKYTKGKLSDRTSIAVGSASGVVKEIKEWQAIMDHLRSLPVKKHDELPVIPVDSRAAETRAIKVG